MVDAYHNWVPDFRQLRSFMAVVDTGSFTRAAAMLGVTQSAVSHSVRTLEDQLGCRILVRGGGHARCTEHGEELYRHCRRIFDQLGAMASQLSGCGEIKA